MTSPRDIIISTYSSMPEGFRQAGVLCPKCNGGSTKEHSLSVGIVDGFLVWKCHRNSCPFQGKESLLVVYTYKKPGVYPPPVKPQKTFTPEPLNSSCALWLKANFSISQYMCDVFQIQKTKDHCSYPVPFPRFVIPLKKRDLSLMGYNLRASSSHDLPKALIIKHQDPLGVAWFNCITGPSSNVIIVEDCWSAIRMTEHMNAVALLGTHLSRDNAEELKSFNMKNYFLALDSDAFGTALEHKEKYKNKLTLQIVSLTVDIKNMPPEGFDKFVKELIKDE
jgi:hypothetical protein